MITHFMTEKMVNLTSGQSEPSHVANEDLIGHEAEIAGTGRRPLYLRLLPRFLRTWIETRRTEAALIEVWRTRPHLMDDIGIVLGRSRVLPTHLTPAPARLLAEVALTSPETIVAAERSYPPQAPQSGKAAAAPAQRPARAFQSLAD